MLDLRRDSKARKNIKDSSVARIFELKKNETR
jgi:hypothetical protein